MTFQIQQANPVGAFLQGAQMRQQQQAQQQQMDLQRQQNDRANRAEQRGIEATQQQRQQWLAENLPDALAYSDTPEKWDQSVAYLESLGFNEAAQFRGRFDMRDALMAQVTGQNQGGMPAELRTYEQYLADIESDNPQRQQAARVALRLDAPPPTASPQMTWQEDGNGVRRPYVFEPRTNRLMTYDGQNWIVATGDVLPSGIGGQQQPAPQQPPQAGPQQAPQPSTQPPQQAPTLFAGRPPEAEAAAVATAEGQARANVERDSVDVQGRRQLDAAFAPEATAWVNGAYEDTLGQLQLLEGVRDQLRSGQNLTGPVLGNVPRTIRNFTNPASVAAQDSVEQVVQRNLRVILGAQFTENEGQRLIARAYNPALDEAENLRRLDLLITQIGEAAAAKNEAVSYFMQNGTLSGFQGSRILQPGGFLAEFDRRVDGRSNNNQPRREQQPGGGVSEGTIIENPQTGEVMIRRNGQWVPYDG